MKTGIPSLAAFFASAAVAAAAASPTNAPAAVEFPRDVRDAIRTLVSGPVRESLAAAAIPAGRAVVVAPIAGDRDGEVRGQLKNALTAAGLVCVEASDDMWEAIMKELGFNEGFKDMLDPRSMTRLGELLPSEVMLYGRVRASRMPPRGRRRAAAPGAPDVELSLHAADLRTRRHVWGGDFQSEKAPAPGPVPPPDEYDGLPQFLPAEASAADLAVFVSARPEDAESSDLALELLSVARETVGAQGFQVALDAKGADVALQLSVRKTVFDRTGNYAVMEGSVRAIATVPARKGFYLGETRIDRKRGERRLGDRDAMLSVRDAVEPELVSWIGQNVTVEKTGIAAVVIPCDVSMLDENAAAKFILDFCAEAVKIDGVARCSLAGQSPERADFYFAYQPDKLPEGPANAVRARHPEFFPDPENDL